MSLRNSSWRFLTAITVSSRRSSASRLKWRFAKLALMRCTTFFFFERRSDGPSHLILRSMKTSGDPAENEADIDVRNDGRVETSSLDRDTSAADGAPPKFAPSAADPPAQAQSTPYATSRDARIGTCRQTIQVKIRMCSIASYESVGGWR